MGNLDTKWLENREQLTRLHIKLGKAMNEVEGLPDDLDHPQSQHEVERVGGYVDHLENINCEFFDCIEKMMLKGDVQERFDEIENDKLPDEGSPGAAIGE